MAEVTAHYDAVASEYSKQYQRSQLANFAEYPANYFRLQVLVNSFLRHGVKRVLEVGVGEGTPLVTLGKLGMDVWGFDLSEKWWSAHETTFAKPASIPGTLVGETSGIA